MKHGETIEADEKDPNWVSTDDAARLCRLTRRVFLQRWGAGDIDCPRYSVAGERGYWWDPTELEVETAVAGEVIDAPTAALLAQAYAHNETLFGQYKTQVGELLEHYRTINASLNSRCSSLESAHAELIAAREAALNDATARQIAQQEAEAQQKRKDEALSKLLEVGPGFLSNWLTRNEAVSFIDSISAEQLEVLIQLANASDDFLTPAQKTMIIKFRDMKDASKQKGKQHEPKNEHSNQRDADPSSSSSGV